MSNKEFNPLLIANIQNEDQMLEFLRSQNNAYTCYILARIDRAFKLPPNPQIPGYQSHHIIPLHADGPDKPFNRIQLTIEEHAIAHGLCYEAYQRIEDMYAGQLISGNIKFGGKESQLLSNEIRRQNKSGFFNSALQSELAKRPRKNKVTNNELKTALANGFNLEHIPTKNILRINPFEFKTLTGVVEKILTEPYSDKEEYKRYVSSVNKADNYYYNTLRKILTGFIPEKKVQWRIHYTFKDWRVLGINLPPTYPYSMEIYVHYLNLYLLTYKLL